MKKFIILLFLFSSLFSFKLDRVILATNDNTMYSDFWPIVSFFWKEYVGLKPTLAVISDKKINIDESLGDVIYFNTIPGVSTATHAQTIRLFLPILFKDSYCLLSDMDMIPLNKSYFLNSVAKVPNNKFVVYRNRAYGPGNKRFPICYCAAKGSVFQEVFNLIPENISKRILELKKLNLGWNTDEIYLTNMLKKWPHFKTRCALLGHDVRQRIDRGKFKYSLGGLQRNRYIDSHLLRPYSKYKGQIDKLVADMRKWIIKRCINRDGSFNSSVVYKKDDLVGLKLNSTTIEIFKNFICEG